MNLILSFLVTFAFTSILFAQENGGPYSSDSNTVLLMHFDGNATNSAAVGNNGIAHGSGVSYVSGGIHGQCLRLDNSTADKQSWIEVPFYNELNFTKEFAIECWFKINSWGENQTGWRTLFKKEGINGASEYQVIFPLKENHSMQASIVLMMKMDNGVLMQDPRIFWN